MIDFPLLSLNSRVFKLTVFIAALFLVLSCNLLSGTPGTPIPQIESPTSSPVPTQVTRVSLNLPDTSGEIAFASQRGDKMHVIVMNADGSDEKNLTAAYGEFAYPSWSPDGQRLAMRSDISDTGIAVMDLRLENGQLTGTPPVFLTREFSDAPTWSPDGSQVMYIASSGGGWQFIRHDLSSGVESLLSGPSGWARDPKWSPDGSRIVFSDDVTNGTTPEIYVANSDGSAKTPLTDTEYYNGDPTWSPDGSKIAYSANPNGNKDIYVMNADGSNVTRLTYDPAAEFDPSWSPDGTRLAFVSDRDGNYEIYLINADGSGEMRLTYNTYTDRWPVWRSGSSANGQGKCQAAASPVADVTIPAGTRFAGRTPFNKIWRLENSGDCVWTPSGFQLRFVDGNQLDGPPAIPMPGAIQPGDQVDLVLPLVAPDAPGQYTSSWQLLDQAGDPAPNPDGNPLTLSLNIEVLDAGQALLPAPLYYLSGPVDARQIWRMEANARTVTQITHEPVSVTSFDASPLDNSLAYVSGQQLILTDGSGNARQVLASASEEERVDHPVWSPDGARLAYGLGGVHVYTPASGEDRLLLPNTGFTSPATFRYFRPNAWSPDGSKLLLGIGLYEGFEQGILDTGSGALLNEFEYGDALSWSQDSQKVFLARSITGEMMALEPGLLHVDAVPDAVVNPLISGSPTWWPYQSPDGRVLFFMGQSDAQDPNQFSVSLSALETAAPGTPQTLRPDLLRLSANGFREGLWSQDGTHIVASLYYPSLRVSEVILLGTDDSSYLHLLQDVSNLRWGR